jgi:hypothetical protein
MPRINPHNLQDELDTLARVWNANPDFKLKTMTLDQFSAKVAAMKALLDAITEKEESLLTLRNERAALLAEMNNVATRTRAGIKGYFGDDSNEYELAGGTPTSKRKKRGRGNEQVADEDGGGVKSA